MCLYSDKRVLMPKIYSSGQPSGHTQLHLGQLVCEALIFSKQFSGATDFQIARRQCKAGAQIFQRGVGFHRL
ncbi:MAG: hypothetical protein GPOALKHO_000679 [Sodalis sp.]|nr:MAG: hypothetical protein GPOALKHO_000679 [Sodalis sp.]